MRFVSYAITDKGIVRPRNEDSYLQDDDLHLYVVADGMGGHKGGDVASSMAVAEIEKVVRSWKPGRNDEMTGVDGPVPEEEARLVTALKRANTRIWKESEQNPERRGMGTTSTGLLLSDGQATVAHVGDSRAYLIRDGRMMQITEDHSWVNEQVKAGFITDEEAREHRLKNLITRSLGHEATVKVDVVRLKVREGDRYFLCSDGLTNLVRDEEIKDIVTRFPSQEALQEMVRLANERGGHDNITAVMVEAVPD